VDNSNQEKGPLAGDEAGSPVDDAEFERVLRNLVNTPHKPHVEPKKPKPDPSKAR
jgi:hypothetical protein